MTGKSVLLYTRHGIPEVRIVDLRQRRVDIHRHPDEAAYRESHTATGPDNVSPLALPECRVTVSTLF